MNRESRRYFEKNGFLIERNSYRKLYRNTKNIEFLECCIRQKVTPKFARISETASKHFSSRDLENVQRKRLETELKNKRIYALNAERLTPKIILTLCVQN